MQDLKPGGLNIQRRLTHYNQRGGEMINMVVDYKTHFYHLPYKEPSGTLTQLLGALVDSGKRFAATIEDPTGDCSSSSTL